jgi:hypothetical protein
MYQRLIGAGQYVSRVSRNFNVSAAVGILAYWDTDHAAIDILAVERANESPSLDVENHCV